MKKHSIALATIIALSHTLHTYGMFTTTQRAYRRYGKSPHTRNVSQDETMPSPKLRRYSPQSQQPDSLWSRLTNWWYGKKVKPISMTEMPIAQEPVRVPLEQEPTVEPSEKKTWAPYQPEEKMAENLFAEFGLKKPRNYVMLDQDEIAPIRKWTKSYLQEINVTEKINELHEYIDYMNEHNRKERLHSLYAYRRYIPKYETYIDLAWLIVTKLQFLQGREISLRDTNLWQVATPEEIQATGKYEPFTVTHTEEGTVILLPQSDSSETKDEMIIKKNGEVIHRMSFNPTAEKKRSHRE